MSPLDPVDHQVCLRVLQAISEDTSLIADDERMKALIAKIHRTGKKQVRKGEQAARRREDRAVKELTAMVERDLLGQSVASTPGDAVRGGQLNRPAACYVCKEPYRTIHPLYHSLCPPCAELNENRREQRADLHGRTAVLTGGRVKIGYHLALRLLRDGARVVLTTRFPRDAARRFGAEPDRSAWAGRLRIQGLDLRNLEAVEAFTASLAETEPHVDILINNAAQTVKRPLGFYQHLMEGEKEPVLLEGLPGYPGMVERLALPGGDMDAADTYFPAGLLDADGQQLDARPLNSWSTRLEHVSTLEALETHLVNAVAPFVLCRRLRPLMLQSPHQRRFIINVSAMEGQFARATKTPNHPHTNMAKAALNMLTRTSATALAAEGIYMNSVDTGWITDEHPLDRRERRREGGFYTPLDLIDGVARIYDPIALGLDPSRRPLFGHFLKDYAPYPW